MGTQTSPTHQGSDVSGLIDHWTDGCDGEGEGIWSDETRVLEIWFLGNDQEFLVLSEEESII